MERGKPSEKGTWDRQRPRPSDSDTRGHQGQALSDHQVLTTLVSALVESNRRWQIVVFPSLFAFVLLAAYGFYLIYNLVEDVDKMASSMSVNVGFMAERMGQISLNIDALTGSVREISVNLDDLTGTVTAMNGTIQSIAVQTQTMPPMLDAMQEVSARIASMDSRIGAMTTSIQHMDGQMSAITAATQHIGGNVSGINQSIGPPMNFMRNIMPW